MARTAMHHSVHGMTVVNEQRDRVGQLHLPAGAARGGAQRVEDRAVQQIAAGSGIV